MKRCTRCGLYMIESFTGCPHCQTDKHIIIVEKYGDTTPKTTRGGNEMTRIDISLNGVGVTYNVNESADEVNKKLYYVRMGNQDFMEFENALKSGLYPIKKLVISPSNCAVIEIIEEVEE